MNKLAILIAIMMLVPSVVFAEGTQSGTTFTVAANGTNPAWSVSLSKNVDLTYDAESAGLAYTLATDHDSGDKKYGSSSGDTKIYYINNTSASLPTAPSTATSTADFSAWTAL